MRVLIGCECSGIVRDYMLDRGHDAWSCDIKPCERGSAFHLQMDVMNAVRLRDWDFIGLHPDCTCMAVSGNRWYGNGTPGHDKRVQAIEWTLRLWHEARLVADKVYLENPVSVIFPHLEAAGASVQYIQPWQYGHGETKKTGFATSGLPALKPTNVVEGREHRVWKMPPSADRKADRSRTFDGVAQAIAKQWA